jgi:WD40 repeat protein/cellulose biosynthesis protein BcsQ
MSQKASREAAPRKQPEGRIITFYSYKGGTGRTMLLANVAWILASHGKRVLVVDWDLEAPGLHRYFRPFLPDPELTSSPGVIDMVTDYAIEAMTDVPPEAKGEFESANILRFASSLRWPFPKPGTIDMVPAGRQGPSYAARVNSFNWQNFYDRLGGGNFLETIRRGMKEEYDYVLIDSRTGVSDTAGICTVQLPDTLVVCFTLNNQSIEGASAIAQSVKMQRNEPDFHVLPVPTRVEDGEKRKLEAARDLARAKFAEFITHVPPPLRTQYWGDVEVPYKIFYAYEEILAVFGDRPEQPTSMLAAASRLTGHLTGGAISRLAPMSEQERLRWLAEFERVRTSPEALSPSAALAQSLASPSPENDFRYATPSAASASPMRSKRSQLTLGAIALSILAVVVGVIYALKPVGGGPAGTADAGPPGEDAAPLPATPKAGDAIVSAARAARDPLVRLLLLAELPDDSEPKGAGEMAKEFAKRPVPVAVLRGHKNAILGARFSPDGNRIVTAGRDGSVRIWSADGRGEPHTIEMRDHENHEIADFDVSRELVAIGTADGESSIWSLSPDVAPYRFFTMKGSLQTVRFSPDGATLLTTTTNHVYVWTVSLTHDGQADIDAGSSDSGGVQHINAEKQGEFEVSKPMRVAAIGEKTILTAGATHIEVWNRLTVGPMPLDTRKVVAAWTGNGATTVKIAFAPDLKAIAAAADTGEIVAWRIDEKGKLQDRTFFKGQTGGIGALAVNGKRLVTGSLDRRVQIWTWGELLPVHAGTHNAAVVSAAFSPDGKSFVTASDDGTAKVFAADAESKSPELFELKGNGASLLDATWSPDGGRVLTTLSDDTLRVWRMDAALPIDKGWPELVHSLRGITSACLSIADRTSLLEETPGEALLRFEACEKANGRSGGI